MNWAIASTAVLIVALAGLILAYEKGSLSARTVGLVAALAALAVAGRLAFAPLPNVKPTTDIILIAGFALGMRAGFAVGAITALVSNMVFGQGPWTPWQMFAWGVAGVLGALLAKATRGSISRWQLALAGAVAGLTFGVIMDVSQWLLYGGSPRESTLIAYSLTSLPWNIAHAVGNVLFAIAFGPALIAAVQRAKLRSEPKWLPRGVPFNALAVPAVLMALVAGVLPISGHAAAGSAKTWLLGTQLRDGGFPVDSRSGGSSPRETGWAALALAASGYDLKAVHKPGGKSLLQRLEADSRDLMRETSDSPEERAGYEQRLLLAAATVAGADVHSFGGRDLVKLVKAGVTRSGAVNFNPGEPSVDLTAYAVMALRGAGVSGSDPAISRAVRWLVRERQHGGGWSTTPRSVSAGTATPDTTGAVLEALKAVGHPKDSAVTTALAYLARSRGRTGGWGFGAGGSNSQSTALAVLGLRAWNGAAAARAASWFDGARGAGGSIRFQQGGGSQTPVWVTAQAVLAMSGRTLPLVTRSAESASSAPVRNSSGGGGSVASSSTDTKQRAATAKNPRESRGLAFSVRAAELAGRVAAAFAKSFSGTAR